MITSANYMLFSRFNSLFVLTPSLKNSVLQLLLMKYSRSKVIRCLNVNFIRHFFLVRLLGSSDTNISVCAFFIKWMCKIFFIRMTDRLWTEVALALPSKWTNWSNPKIISHWNIFSIRELQKSQSQKPVETMMKWILFEWLLLSVDCLKGKCFARKVTNVPMNSWR